MFFSLLSCNLTTLSFVSITTFKHKGSSKWIVEVVVYPWWMNWEFICLIRFSRLKCTDRWHARRWWSSRRVRDGKRRQRRIWCWALLCFWPPARNWSTELAIRSHLTYTGRLNNWKGSEGQKSILGSTLACNYRLSQQFISAFNYNWYSHFDLQKWKHKGPFGRAGKHECMCACLWEGILGCLSEWVYWLGIFWSFEIQEEMWSFIHTSLSLDTSHSIYSACVSY